MLIVFEGKDLPPECDSIAGGSGFCVAKDERGLAGEACIESREQRLERRDEGIVFKLYP